MVNAQLDRLASTFNSPRRLISLGGFLLVTVLLVRWGLHDIFSFPVRQDIAWFQYLAEQILQGKLPYRDFIEINPPLYIWMHVPIVQLANNLQIDTVFLYRCITLLGVACISVVIIYLTNQGFIKRDKTFPFINALVLLFGFINMAGYVFGEREFWAYAMAMLYIASCWAWLNKVKLGRWGRLVLYTGISLGLLVKIQFLLVVGIVEMFLLISQGSTQYRTRIGEVFTILGCTSIYLMLILIFAGDYFSLLVKIGAMYLNFAPLPWYEIIFRSSHGLMFVVTMIIFFLPLKAEYRSWTRLQAVFTISVFCVVLLQQKGWDYHLYPFYAAFTYLVFWTGYFSFISFFSARFRLKSTTVFTVGALGIILFCTHFLQLMMDRRKPDSSYFALKNILQQNKPRSSVFLFSVSMYPSFPLITETRSHWAGRINHLWYLIVKNKDQPAVQSQIKNLDEMVISDIVQSQPDLLIIDNTDAQFGFMGNRFDYIAYFSQYKGFADIFSQYRYATSVDGYDVYRRDS
jgi:hypothetical protein